MRRAMSTLVYAKRERLHPGLLDQFVSGGAEAIEIFAARGHFNYTDRQHIREIGNWFRNTGVTFHSMHSPMYSDEEWGRSGTTAVNIAAVEKRDRIAATDEIKRALEVAEQAPFQFLVQHVGVGNEGSNEHKLEAAMSSLEHLHAFAKPLGVQLLVENITQRSLHAGEPDGVAASRTLHRYRRLLRRRPRSHHVNGEAGLRRAERPHPLYARARQQQGPRLPSVAGQLATIDWTEAMSLLRTAPHVPPLLLEIEGVEGENISEKMAEAFGRLER